MLTDQEKKDVQLVLKTLEEVVNELGSDFVYPDRPALESNLDVDCYYVWKGKPDCIAARVLHKLGVSVDTLAEHEGGPCQNIPSPLSVPALTVLGTAQQSQDERYPYGEALLAARREVTED